ncbi:plant/protein (DUF789) [Rhynchospora pubera]|uniref:Plant/protein (DUF789) n=1 Tax=Rhynchospora pubera TaxID=906938 RepID=A0AAV8DK97_9POAL|nr:plant/protein (DUF789) [Rhynchospora pubera]
MAAKRSNLKCFLDSVTPVVDSHLFSETPSNKRSSICNHCGEENFVECFTLSDLWESLCEWSVYGVGVNIVLPNGESIVQYFVPYLSAIQLYTNEKFMASSRNLGSDNEMCGSGKDYHKKEPSQSSSTFSMDSIFSKMDLGDAKKDLGCKHFEYFEMSSPYTRMPLVDKVQELAQDFPDLNSFKIMELSPASWMSISWYPIYTIPAQLDYENYDACFLTYHRFSSTFQNDSDETLNLMSKCSDSTSKESFPSRNKVGKNDKNMAISLAPFGLATLKADGALWNNPENGDSTLAASLLCAARSWLHQVQAQHHDFEFFINN